MKASPKLFFLTLSEVALIERVHPKTVERLARQGLIPGAKKIAGRWRINSALYAKHRGLTVEQISESVLGAQHAVNRGNKRPSEL